MAHPHLALAIVLVLVALAAAVWLGTLLTDANAELKRALGEDAGLDILTVPSDWTPSAWQPADDGFPLDDIYQPEQPPVIHRRAPGPHSALYVRSCSHGRHRS
jgi:hypothetical protein